jgi:CBS domain-containing protein
MRVFELMKTHVIKTLPDATLHDAVDMMDLYQVSGLPVVDSGERLLGIVTEYDVIQALLPQFAEAAESGAPDRHADFQTLVERVKKKTVEQVMSKPAVAIDEDADVLEAAQVMVTRRFKRLPVTHKGRLVGIISRIDICQALLEGQLFPLWEQAEPEYE